MADQHVVNCCAYTVVVCCHRHSLTAQHDLCSLNKSRLRSSVLLVQLSLGRRSATTPAPAPASVVSASALAPAAVSQVAGLSSIASAPLTAPAPGPAVPVSAPAQAPAAAHAPATASEKALISMAAPAPALAAVSSAVTNSTAATTEAQQTTRELYNTQVRTWIIPSLQQVSLLLLSCIAHCKPFAYTSLCAAKISSDTLRRYQQSASAL